MAMPVTHAYVLEIGQQPPAVFTWPNCVKKYLRDIYTRDGVLHLPPPGHIILKRYKVNPKAGQATIVDRILDMENFLA